MEKTETVINLDDEKVERWRQLAENSTPVTQICTIPRDGDWESALVEEGGEVIAKEMDYLDAFFFGEARVAVLVLTRDVMLLQQYANYVAECVEALQKRGTDPTLLPVSFEVWLTYSDIEQMR